MKRDEKLTEQTFTVRLIRPSTGSAFSYQVQAVSIAQAQRKAENDNPGWKANGIG
jgi:hypothetical protein